MNGLTALEEALRSDFPRGQLTRHSAESTVDTEFFRYVTSAENAREAVRDLVLELSMDQAVDQTLAAAPCDACGKPRYVAALHCASCKV